jgi:hypothetical protein
MAKDLYTSMLFLKCRRYVERHYDSWYILSAKHHLLDPSRKIEPYELTLNQMPAAEKQRWSQAVLMTIRKQYPNPTKVRFFLHAGEEYRKYLIPLLEEKGYACEVPLKGMRVGEQLRWYNSQNS